MIFFFLHYGLLSFPAAFKYVPCILLQELVACIFSVNLNAYALFCVKSVIGEEAYDDKTSDV